MNPLTIVVVQARAKAETKSLQRALPAITSHLRAEGGFLGQPFRIEVWADAQRSEEGGRELAQRVASRNDVAAVLMWGGSWIGPVTARVQQVFLENTKGQPFIYLSGSVLPEHAVHPGSFSLAPAFRDKAALLRLLCEDIPGDGGVAWLAKSGDDPEQRTAVEEICAARDLPFHAVELPASFETGAPSPADFARLLELVAAIPAATHWFVGAFALNHPLNAWLRTREAGVEVVQLNTGARPEWFEPSAAGGEIFFGSDGSSEKPDLELSRKFTLGSDFPRIKLDALLLLQHAAKLVPPLRETASREEVYARWRSGMLLVDGLHSVFVGTRTALWFDPETRMRRSGGISLKRREPGGVEGLLHPAQIAPRGDGAVVRVPVAFVFIDLLSMASVSIERGSVQLDFYLDIRTRGEISIDDLRFVNADRGSLSIQCLIDRSEGAGSQGVRVRRYQVTGGFAFKSRLGCFPIDSQSIEVEIAPANPMIRNFLIQPPPRAALDRHFEVAGWSIIDADVSVHTMFWRTATSDRFDMRFQPYAAVGFHWMLARTAKDTILFVAVPMSVLLGVSYFSSFADFESASSEVGQLTTTMLAAIALYFATAKPSSTDLTILDRVFRVAYITIGGLLGTILVTSFLAPAIHEAAMWVWRVLFPLLIVVELMRARRLVLREKEAFRPPDGSGGS